MSKKSKIKVTITTLGMYLLYVIISSMITERETYAITTGEYYTASFYDAATSELIKTVTVCPSCGETIESKTPSLPKSTSKNIYKGWYLKDRVQNCGNILVNNATNFIVGYTYNIEATYETDSITRQNECNIDGGSITISLNTIGGEPLPLITECIGCMTTTTLPTPNRDGYTFAGWYYDNYYTTKWGNGTWPIGTEKILYAKWNQKTKELNSSTCEPLSGGSWTLKYNTNGGNIIENESVCVACGPDAYTTLPTPIREGYTFGGWYYDSNLEHKVNANSTLEIKPIENYDENECMIGYKSITIYAEWIKNNVGTVDGGSYQIIFNTNVGNNIEKMAKCVACEPNYSSPLLPTPTKSGYQFMGWYMDENLKTPYTTFKAINNETYNVYAKWQKNSEILLLDGGSYKIIFNTNGGNTINDITKCVACEPNYATPQLPNPTKSGYQFMGWYMDKRFKTPYTVFPAKNGENYTVYAKWQKTKSAYELDGGNYIIKYITFGGNSINDMTKCVACEPNYASPTLDTPLRDGYTFEGWYMDENYTTPYTTFPAINGETYYVYAKWTSNVKFMSNESDLKTYKLYFESNGGDKVEGMNICINCGESYIPIIPKIQKGCNIFEGWYVDKELTIKYDYNTYKGESGKIYTVYAKWTSLISDKVEPTSFTIKYNPNSGIISKTTDKICIAEGVEVTGTLENPTKTGYTFMGWYKDENLKEKYTDISGSPNEIVTLYAKWQLNEDNTKYILNIGLLLALIATTINTIVKINKNKKLKKELYELNNM